jgi:hypothetical protein
MKGKFGVIALLLSSLTFAAPVSAPSTLNDTPIISGGGIVSGISTCKAYTTDGAVVPLQGGETLVFYGGGTYSFGSLSWSYYATTSAGGYLYTKSSYSGPAYVRIRGRATGFCEGYACGHGSGIGLFAKNTTDIQDFIAGAGAACGMVVSGWGRNTYYYFPAAGGGWIGEPNLFVEINPSVGSFPAVVSRISWRAPGNIYGYWNNTWFGTSRWDVQGFYGASVGGAASSISAWYNYYTKNYTSVGSSLTITGGGSPGVDTPTLYVCQ